VANAVTAPIALALAALAAACGGHNPVLPDAAQPCTAQQDPARTQALAQLRDAALAMIVVSPCASDACEMVAFHAAPAVLAPGSAGARILLIDEAIETVAVTRYPHRTLGTLVVEPDGTYRAGDVTLQIAKDALAVFQAVVGFGEPLSSEEIDVAVPFAAKFSAAIPNWTGHGMDILPFLADRIPRAQFLVSEALLDYPLKDPQVCGVNADATREAAVLRLEAQLERTAQSLSGLIQQYAINYIHLSWGTTRAQIGQLLQSRCGAAPANDVLDRIQAAYLRLLRGLSALSTSVAALDAPTGLGAVPPPRPVVMLQAGTGADRDLRADDPDYLTDCTAFPGRLRVFAAAYTGTDVPAEGSSNRKYLTPFAARALACLDVIVNVGYAGPFDARAAPTFFPSSALGLGVGARPGWPAVSSFANPVALAYFSYLADLHPEEDVPQLMSRITNQWKVPTVDPLLYGSFPRPPSRCAP
jgi:hypothetical protein